MLKDPPSRPQQVDEKQAAPDKGAVYSFPKSLLDNTLAVLNYVLRDMSETLIGFERQEFICDRLDKLDDRASGVLRKFYEMILLRMRDLEASDIDMGSFGTNGEIWFRIFGRKMPQRNLPKFNSIMTDVLILGLLMPKQRKILLQEKSLDFSYHNDVDGMRNRYRGAAYFDLDGIAMNMRAIVAIVRNIDGYEFFPGVLHLMDLRHSKEGMILITGITGSGKSTTLDAIIDMNNAGTDSHIVIIGSPIEYVHKPKRSVVRHREVGRDVNSFKEGTVQALRQDPDIVVIGEMRDPETIMAALEITDSGHKVFSTLHTSSAVESIDRIIGEVPANEQERVKNRLADVLRVVISQKLIPTLEGKRALATEILLVTPSVRSAVKNGNISEVYQMIHEGSALGMHTMEQDLRRLVRQRLIGSEEAMNYSNHKKRMKQLLTKQ